jgi:hypothetical protein
MMSTKKRMFETLLYGKHMMRKRIDQTFGKVSLLLIERRGLLAEDRGGI